MLKEWILNYIKNRDILLKSITSIEENKKQWDIVVKKKEGIKYFLVKPIIKDISEIVEKLNDEDITIVVLNTKANLDIVIENWSKLKECRKLCIIFANPDSELEKRWIIFPHTHERVTEKASLTRGLKSLFQTVEPWKK
jgi:hypothetical protein